MTDAASLALKLLNIAIDEIKMLHTIIKDAYHEDSGLSTWGMYAEEIEVIVHEP